MAKTANTEEPVQAKEVCTRIDLSYEAIGELVTEADHRFSHIGGDKFNYIFGAFLPLLKEKGYTICECK